jgi:cell division transport system permease protein
LAAVIMVSLTCFVAYAFSLFVIGTERILQYFETRPQVIAFFELDAPTDAINRLADTMRSKSYVENVSVVSKDQALEMYQQDNKDDPLLLELVTADILPASIEVSGKSGNDLDQIKSDLETGTAVDDVVFQKDVIDSLNTWTSSVRLIGIGSVALLSLTSFLIVMVIIGIKITAKKHAINIMRIIGATRWYIKRPFMVEGMLYGLAGSLIGWSAMFGGLLYLTPWLQNFLGTVPLFPIPPEVFAIQVGVGTLLAILIGMLAAMVASQRLIKR